MWEKLLWELRSKVASSQTKRQTDNRLVLNNMLGRSSYVGYDSELA